MFLMLYYTTENVYFTNENEQEVLKGDCAKQLFPYKGTP